VLLVTQAGLKTLAPSKVTAKAIGVKAIGLLAIPVPWVPKFFVVSGNGKVNQAHIKRAAEQVGNALSEVFVRSNGTQEGMEERGTYDSDSCAISDIGNLIKRLRTRARAQDPSKGTLHFLVQEKVPIRARGHLSNERRLSQHFRDWNAEIDNHPGLKPVSVRNWRDASSASTRALLCNTTANIPRTLRAVAAWLGNVRGHFEWVWDGACLWIVQLDILATPHGAASPRSLVSISDRPAFQPDDLRLFTRVTTEHGSGYRKLRNAELYRQLGYTLPNFYVMNDCEAMRSLLEDRRLVQGLRHDLSRLCRFPLVIRTDASDLNTEQRQMLPRSEELRSLHAAEEWLLQKFRPAILNLGSATNVALIAHHFVPATASAWAQATPSERRVRIEALWGIPEGLYYFAHDVFDVDTGHADLQRVVRKRARCVSSRVRYRGNSLRQIRRGSGSFTEPTSVPTGCAAFNASTGLRRLLALRGISLNQ